MEENNNSFVHIYTASTDALFNQNNAYRNDISVFLVEICKWFGNNNEDSHILRWDCHVIPISSGFLAMTELSNKTVVFHLIMKLI